VCREFEELLLIDLQKSIILSDSQTPSSVFFGGGTPSLMTPGGVENILRFLFKNCPPKNDIEITLEANPATFDKTKMRDFKNAGINRLSLGIQSFSNENLKFLGRIYDEKQAIAAAEIVSAVFENFSFDFMYGYEGQTPENLRRDLCRAVDLKCRHVSCYQLTFEENTTFYRDLLSGIIKKPGENEEVAFFNLIEDILGAHNIFRYEISNYAVPGFESRHNLSYWKYDDYLGVGPGAHSRISSDGKKCEMIKTSDPFLWKTELENNQSGKINILSEEEKLREMIITGLRTVKGIAMKNLYEKNSPTVVDEIISCRKLDFLKKQKLIEDEDEHIRPTRDGLLKINSVIEFLA
jgi:oxygen-independent coproporphyrinogen-3 oxidase